MLRWLNNLDRRWIFLLMFLAVWAFALARRSRRLRLEALVDRAQQAEVDRDRQARLATAAERARIAREMHDIVAHSLSVIIAQADGGRYAAAADPEAPTRTLTTIGEIGRAALTDMRRLLGVLREDGNGHDEPPGILPTTPTPACSSSFAAATSTCGTGTAASPASWCPGRSCCPLGGTRTAPPRRTADRPRTDFI